MPNLKHTAIISAIVIAVAATLAVSDISAASPNDNSRNSLTFNHVHEKSPVIAVSYVITGNTFSCPDGRTFDSSGTSKSTIYWDPSQGRAIATQANERSPLGNANVIFSLDISDNTYHMSGFASGVGNRCSTSSSTLEEKVTFDWIGACDGSYAIITPREANSWNITLTDSQISVACLTAPTG